MITLDRLGWGLSKLISQIIKFGLVGVLNTAITFLVIAALTLFEVNPYLSNAAGFTAGLINSYVLNSRFTFHQNFSATAALKFGTSFAVAYTLNLIALHYLVAFVTLPTITAQFIAMVVYNIGFFTLMKTWVFVHN